MQQINKGKPIQLRLFHFRLALNVDIIIQKIGY